MAGGDVPTAQAVTQRVSDVQPVPVADGVFAGVVACLKG